MVCHSIMSVNIVYHPALRRPRGWVAVVLCAGLAGGWLFTRPPREIKIETYVWQRRDSSELRDALERSKPLLARCHFLGIEMGRDASGWRVSRSSVPDELFEGQGLVLRLGASLAGETWENSETIDRVMEEAAWLAAKPAAELQIDYDCPQGSLDFYRRLLDCIKTRFPQRRWTITALPSWLGEPAAKRLFDAADGVVLQVHSLQLPKNPAQPIIICDPSAARAAVKRMKKFGKPFRVAINTYACEVLFDGEGRIIDVISEDIDSPPPLAATRRSAGISDAVALAELVAEWRRNPPHGLEGIIWYRLPLETDRRNWRWQTWAKVAVGEVPNSALRIEAQKTPQGAWDLVVSNAGERDERLPEFLAIGCETLVLEGINGYLSEGASRLRLDDAPWPWLPPGASLTAGWLRTTNSSALPQPTLITSP